MDSHNDSDTAEEPDLDAAGVIGLDVTGEADITGAVVEDLDAAEEDTIDVAAEADLDVAEDSIERSTAAVSCVCPPVVVEVFCACQASMWSFSSSLFLNFRLQFRHKWLSELCF